MDDDATGKTWMGDTLVCRWCGFIDVHPLMKYVHDCYIDTTITISAFNKL